MTTTVIIPSVGRPALHRALESLITQTNKDWTARVVLNNTVPDFEITIQDPRIEYINIGTVDPPDYGALARNTILDTLDTEYVSFLDDDDWYEDRFIEIMSQADQLRYCTAKLWDNEKAVGFWLKQPSGEILRSNFIIPSTVLMKSAVIDVCRFVSALGYNSDWGFFTCLYEQGCSFRAMDTVLSNYTLPRADIYKSWPSGGYFT